MPAPESLVGLACQVNDQIAQALQPVLKNYGLTPATFDLLSSIRAGDGRETQADVGKRIGLSRATISEAVSSLQTQELVRRSPCPTDSRAVLLVLTPAGHQKVSAVLNEMRRIEMLASQALSEKEATIVTKALKKLLVGIKSEVES